ncbi:MAG: hypothetical protein IPM51_12320 [Sphingobacteriaceae bacterium]|nr:hypothetical protein [Sphingobacteriaceae bacterium]
MTISAEQHWFVSLNAGMQMSGYKSEDFISSNYSPLFNFTAGKWLSPLLALQIGYKGFYFYSISDDLKHHYDYLYAEAALNLNNALNPERSNKDWSLLLHTGVGYFYNHLYGKPNTCVNIGFQNTYQIANQFQASLDVSSIIGWDIYQGDADILPGITLGVIYIFNGP